MTSDLLIAKAWSDKTLFDRLLSNPTRVAEEMEIKISNLEHFLFQLQNRPNLTDENLFGEGKTPVPCSLPPTYCCPTYKS